MGQDRISDLGILSIEHTLVNTVDKHIDDYHGEKSWTNWNFNF